jgi:hypothetical protein
MYVCMYVRTYVLISASFVTNAAINRHTIELIHTAQQEVYSFDKLSISFRVIFRVYGHNTAVLYCPDGKQSGEQKFNISLKFW